MKFAIALICALALFAPMVSAHSGRGKFSRRGRRAQRMPSGGKSSGCMSATYELTFTNTISKRRFPFIPDNGLVFSPLVSAAHNGKFSVLTFRGFASEAVTAVAELGQNSKVVAAVSNNPLVKSSDAADGPTMGGKSTTLTLKVDCDNTFISALSMIAPSPDWIIALPNYQTYQHGRFVNYASGNVRIYDAGTDKGPSSGTVFTPPGETSLDVPQEPQYNIHPLTESSEDPGFNGAYVGKWVLRKMK